MSQLPASAIQLDALLPVKLMPAPTAGAELACWNLSGNDPKLVETDAPARSISSSTTCNCKWGGWEYAAPATGETTEIWGTVVSFERTIANWDTRKYSPPWKSAENSSWA